MSSEQPEARPVLTGSVRRTFWYRLELGIKRLMDVVLCLAVLILGLPLLVLTAVLVKISSPGPVFFVQERIGKDEKPFRMIKFRSMKTAPVEAQGARSREAEAARMTPIGRFLRDYGFDELPQVLNILKGEMSIVGPRAPLPARAWEFTARQRKMFQMRPGWVSLAYRGRRSIPMEQRIELHVQYVETWSMCLDLMILVRSIPVVLLRQGVADVETG